MAMISFAFSIHNFISSVGADAGFAAIIGLAILILLYFAHARETANLREEAAMLSERLQESETRVAQLTRAQAAPSEAGPAAPAHAPATAMGLAPFAPAGTGAPALASATRVVPLPVSVPQPPPAAAQPAGAPPLVAAPAIATVVPEPAPAAAEPSPAVAPAAPFPAGAPATPSPAVAAATASPSVAATAPSPSAPAPTPSPSAAVATAEGPAPSVRPATAAGGNGAGPPADPPPVAARPGWSSPSDDTSSRPFLGDLPPLDGARPTRRPFRRGLVVTLAALAVVAAAVALVAVTSLGGSSKRPTAASTTNAPGTRPSPSAAAFKPSSVTVSVLNGTSTNQLAHRIGQKLAASGYKEGTIATAANQTETATVVAYLPGAKNRKDAQHVAASLGLHPSAVRAIDPSTQQVACPVSTSCTSNVVVTVGADLATL